MAPWSYAILEGDDKPKTSQTYKDNKCACTTVSPARSPALRFRWALSTFRHDDDETKECFTRYQCSVLITHNSCVHVCEALIKRSVAPPLPASPRSTSRSCWMGARWTSPNGTALIHLSFQFWPAVALSAVTTATTSTKFVSACLAPGLLLSAPSCCSHCFVEPCGCHRCRCR